MVKWFFASRRHLYCSAGNTFWNWWYIYAVNWIWYWICRNDVFLIQISLIERSQLLDLATWFNWLLIDLSEKKCLHIWRWDLAGLVSWDEHLLSQRGKKAVEDIEYRCVGFCLNLCKGLGGWLRDSFKAKSLLSSTYNFSCYCFHSPHYLDRKHSHCRNILDNVASLSKSLSTGTIHSWDTSSQSFLARVLFLKLCHKAHTETHTPDVSFWLLGLTSSQLSQCWVCGCVCAYFLAPEIYAVFYKGGKVMPSQGTQTSFCIHKLSVVFIVHILWNFLNFWSEEGNPNITRIVKDFCNKNNHVYLYSIVCVSLVYKWNELYFPCIFHYVTFTLPAYLSPFCTKTDVLSFGFMHTHISGTSEMACTAYRYLITLLFLRGLHTFKPTSFTLKD